MTLFRDNACLLVTWAANLLRDKRPFEISMFDIPGFLKKTYIVKMAGTTNVSRYVRGIRNIGVRDTEVVLYFHQI